MSHNSSARMPQKSNSWTRQSRDVHKDPRSSCVHIAVTKSGRRPAEQQQHRHSRSGRQRNHARGNSEPHTTFTVTMDVSSKQRDPHANKAAHDSKPRGDHNVIKHFAKDPQCDVRRMTKTMRASCKTRPLIRAGGVSLVTLTRRHNYSGPQELELGKRIKK